MNNIIYLAILLLIEIVAFLIGKYIFPTLKNNDTFNDIVSWVYKFVVSAKNQFKDDSGEEKLAYVSEQVKILCEKYEVNLTDDQIRALIEEAYDKMKQAQENIIK